MRYLVLSDVHANIDALDAVLDCAAGAYDHVIVLGDLVGYGAEPNAVVERIRDLSPATIIRGNHDKVAAGQADSEGFNPTAQRAVTWTRRALTAASRDYLSALPKGPAFLQDSVEICHGSPLDEDEYIFGESDAADALVTSERPLCLFGHTHVPMAATLDERRTLAVLFHGAGGEQRLHLDDDRRYLVNPGSVGQPRDGDPRASFALLDLNLRDLVIRRVSYPAARARERILAAGLPKALGNRLLVGR
jgi:diadenosine tetraphosphatase ApaH/serine/threonine PP2A family protein phosphatase